MEFLQSWISIWAEEKCKLLYQVESPKDWKNGHTKQDIKRTWLWNSAHNENENNNLYGAHKPKRRKRIWGARASEVRIWLEYMWC